MAQFLLVPVRTSRQGMSLNAGKLKADYQDETTTVEIHPEDMASVGLKKGDMLRLRAENGHSIVVKCKPQKGEGASPGMMFIAYGPSSSVLMEADTAGTGMPLSKHISVELEGPLDANGQVLSSSPLVSENIGKMAAGNAFTPLPYPLDEWQTNLFRSLTSSSLTPLQAAWLSGYFAALGSRGGQLGEGISAAATGHVPAAYPIAPECVMTVLFGSQTGNGEGIAERLGIAAKEKGHRVKVVDMGEYDPALLESEPFLAIIVSTHGEGDPPIPAEKLHAFLHSENAPRLEDTRYAVFGLGDSSYRHFCKTGKDFDTFLEKLGATRVLKRVDADVDFEEPAAAWTEQVLEAYSRRAGGAALDMATEKPTDRTISPVVSYSKTHPYPATIRVNVNMNGEGSIKETRHIEIDLGDSGVTYEPGDALGVYPKNNPVYIEALLTALNMDGDAPVTVGKEELSLHEALCSRLDSTALSRPVMEKYVALLNGLGGDQDKLYTLLSDANNEEFERYTWGRQILDLVEEYPAVGLSPQDFVSVLRRIPARLYSIASSLKAHPGEVHLIVGAVRYCAHNRDREGVCSTFLAGRVLENEKLPIYVQPNKHFRLPVDPSVPIIMVGPGTGIAPFRAFVEEREATGATGKNWLFFGDQHRACDYLYGEEWDEKVRKGILTRCDLAFSRDQAQKIYVQTRILEHAKEMYAWLEEGAYFYVCGDASRMASDVHKALLQVVEQEAAVTREKAEEYIQALADHRRYLRDVY